MSYDDRKRNRQRKKRFRITVISFILLYLILRSVPTLLANNAKTTLPEMGTLIDKFDAQGFVIKKETIVKATSNGELELLPKEGTRVSAGAEIANINILNEHSSLKQELEQINNSIIALEKSESDAEIIIKEKGKIEELQISTIDDLQSMINVGKFDEVYLLKEKLNLYDDKVSDVSSKDTLLGQSIENLKSRKKVINEEMNKNHMKYYSDHGGIISYKVDGYEELYFPKDFENYTYDKINLHTSAKDKINDKKTSINVGEPIFKIVDNFEWYIGIKVEDMKSIKDLENNKGIIIEIKEDKKELRGRIVAINTSGNKGVIIIKLDTMLHEYYNMRFPELNIIKSKIEGLKIPTKSIVDKESLKGVYIKDPSSIVRFRPINILGEDEKYTYIEKGDSKAFIKVNGEENPVKTITLFDEVFLNTSNIKEGQILN
jgi:putative membrane fusion protein